MGSRGPLRLVSATQTAEEALRGTAQQDVPAEARVLYKPARVKESESLSALWDEIVPGLNRAGLLTAADVPALEVAIRHFRAFIALDEEWFNDQFESVIEDQNGQGSTTKKNPLETAHRSQSAIFMDYCKQLGMTFTSRARTQGRDSDSSSGDENPFLAI